MTASTGNRINSIIGIASNGINLLHGDANLISAVNISTAGINEQESVAYTFDNQNRVSTISYTLSTGAIVARAYYLY